MGTMNHRIWLKVSMAGGGKTSKEFAKELFTVGNISGDIEFYINQIISNSSDDSWYFPLSGPIPSYVLDGSYQRQTPDWGYGNRAMADIAGGLAKTAGALLGGVPLIGSKARSLLTGVGEFMQSFSGDIDSPKIWMRSEFKAVDLSSRIGFENEAEFIYYRMAEIWFTLMTMPLADNSSDAAKKLQDFVKNAAKAINVSPNGPVSKFQIFAMQRPNAGVSTIDVVVGESDDLLTPGSAVKLNTTVDNRPLTLFSLNDVYLTAFASKMGGDTARGIDGRGVPRLVDFSFAFEAAQLNSALDGIRRLMKSNAARYRGVKYGVEKADIDSTLDGPRSILPPAASQKMKAAVKARQVATIPVQIAEALMYNVLNANVSLAAAQYVAGRALRVAGPTRVLVGAHGKSTTITSGIPGLLYNVARNISGQ